MFFFIDFRDNKIFDTNQNKSIWGFLGVHIFAYLLAAHEAGK